MRERECIFDRAAHSNLPIDDHVVEFGSIDELMRDGLIGHIVGRPGAHRLIP